MQNTFDDTEICDRLMKELDTMLDEDTLLSGGSGQEYSLPPPYNPQPLPPPFLDADLQSMFEDFTANHADPWLPDTDSMECHMYDLPPAPKDCWRQADTPQHYLPFPVNPHPGLHSHLHHPPQHVPTPPAPSPASSPPPAREDASSGYRFAGSSPLPMTEVKYPVFSTRDPVQGETHVDFILLGVVDIKPIIDYDTRIMANKQLFAEAERRYELDAQTSGRDLGRSILYQHGNMGGRSLISRVDMNNVVACKPDWGIHNIRTIYLEEDKKLVYSMGDILNCMDYATRRGANTACVSICNSLPTELRHRTVSMRWGHDGGMTGRYGDPFAIHGMLIYMSTLKNGRRTPGSVLRESFTDQVAKDFCVRVVFGRLSNI